MKDITHTVAIHSAKSTIFHAISTQTGIASWFTPHVTGNGQVGSSWELELTNQPHFNWLVLTSKEDEQVAWKCTKGPGNAVGTEVSFTLSPASNDETNLTISHHGWSKDDPNFDKCVEIWRSLLSHLQQYCETGVADPAYQ